MEMGEGPNITSGPWAYANWKLALAQAPASGTFEYTLYSDADFTGNLIQSDLPYQVLNMIADPAIGDGARPAITLRINMHESDLPEKITRQLGAIARQAQTFEESKAKKNRGRKPKSDYSRFHGGELYDEVAALLSLSLGVRIQAGELTREFRPNDDPLGTPVGYASRLIPPFTRQRGSPILPNATGVRALEDALPFLTIYPKFSPEQAIALLRAARSYQQALWVGESNPQLAWLLLVSAIEVGANQWYKDSALVDQRSALEQLEEAAPELTEILKPLGDGTVIQPIAEHLIPSLRSTQKFLTFLSHFCQTPPEPRPSLYSISWDSGDLKKSLAVIYGLRSKALHEGIPFPTPMCQMPFPLDATPDGTLPLAEAPYFKQSFMQGGFFIGEEMPMLINTFEYITREALKKWWHWMEQNSP